MKTRFDLGERLIGYWPLDESSGPRNSLGCGRLGRAFEQNGSVGTIAGKISALAASFTGAGTAYLRTDPPDPVHLSGGGTDITVGGWFFANSFGATRPMFIRANSDGSVREFRGTINSTGHLGFSAWHTTNGTAFVGLTHSAVCATGVWSFVVMEWNRITRKCGIRLNNAAMEFIDAVSPEECAGVEIPLFFGFDPAVQAFDGGLNGWFYYRRILSPREHSKWWNGGNGLQVRFPLAFTEAEPVP